MKDYVTLKTEVMAGENAAFFNMILLSKTLKNLTDPI